ncbi:hypothetical protein Tco_1108693 [Tanacetum coccineum]
MEWLPICDQLEKAVGARTWEMIEACQDRIAFVRELESVEGITIMMKTIMFLKEMMDKEGSMGWKLHYLGKEAEERARETEMFVQKLKFGKSS